MRLRCVFQRLNTLVEWWVAHEETLEAMPHAPTDAKGLELFGKVRLLDRLLEPLERRDHLAPI